MSFSDDANQEIFKQLHEELGKMGVFRRGTINVRFRKCGKPNCVCAQEDHPGHGPQTILTFKQDGKTRTTNLGIPAEVDLVRQQLSYHKEFQQWCKRWLACNEQICDRQLQECRAQSGAARKKKPRS